MIDAAEAQRLVGAHLDIEKLLGTYAEPAVTTAACKGEAHCHVFIPREAFTHLANSVIEIRIMEWARRLGYEVKITRMDYIGDTNAYVGFDLDWELRPKEN